MPEMSAASGWPWPDIRWQAPHANLIPWPPVTDRGRLDLVGDVECPVGESLGDSKGLLRAELPHHEERREGAHEDGDAAVSVGAEDSADHGGSPLPLSTKVRVIPARITTSISAASPARTIRPLSSADVRRSLSLRRAREGRRSEARSPVLAAPHGPNGRLRPPY